ncbi:MAG: TIGR01906 family membrane protein [Christensenellales bacterium]|jgi:integral membrane protein (TIGR01906 family)
MILNSAGKGRRGVASAAAAVMVLPLLLALLLASVAFFSGFLPFYEYAYEKHGIYEATGMSRESLRNVTGELISYIQGGTGDLYINETVHGQVRQVFNEKEIGHMVDVLALFNLLRLVLWICAGAVVALILLALLIAPKGAKGYSISRGVLCTLVPFALLLVAGAAYVMFDFNNAFLQFHYLFFAGDAQMKWVLNPATDIMIQIVPEGFFVDIAVAIFASFIAAMLILLVVSAAVFLKKRKVLVVGYEELSPQDMPELEFHQDYEEEMSVPVLEPEDGNEPPQRPTADEIFESMGIRDDSQVPDSVRELIEETKREYERRKHRLPPDEGITTREIMDRLKNF